MLDDSPVVLYSATVLYGASGIYDTVAAGSAVVLYSAIQCIGGCGGLLLTHHMHPQIQPWDAAILLVYYAGYILFMYFNTGDMTWRDMTCMTGRP